MNPKGLVNTCECKDTRYELHVTYETYIVRMSVVCRVCENNHSVHCIFGMEWFVLCTLICVCDTCMSIGNNNGVRIIMIYNV